MASYSKAKSTTQTLAAATPDIVTLTQIWDGVEVTNVTGASRLAFTIDGSTPAVDGDNVYHVDPAPASLKVPCSVFIAGQTVVTVVGNGNKYSVQGLGVVDGSL